VQGSPRRRPPVRATFSEYAAKIGIDVERFKNDMNSQEVKNRIQRDQDRGASVGVDRTPVLFIDGVQVPYASLDEQGLRRDDRCGAAWIHSGTAVAHPHSVSQARSGAAVKLYFLRHGKADWPNWNRRMTSVR
jgi:hypothetical protein